MSPSRAALALFVLGLVLVPGPAYAIVAEQVDEPERYRSSAGYEATPINVSDDELLADEYAREFALRTNTLKYHYATADYRAPNETREVLEHAIRNGSATIPSRAVHDDLRHIERNYTFLTTSYDAYYRFSVPSEGVTMQANVANDSEIAQTIRDELIVSYERLSRAERSTFDKIRNASESPDQYSYRPWADEPVPEAPLVEYDGTYYDVRAASHVDNIDFPDGLFLGIAASGVGLISLVASGGITLYGRWRE